MKVYFIIFGSSIATQMLTHPTLAAAYAQTDALLRIAPRDMTNEPVGGRDGAEQAPADALASRQSKAD